MDGCAGVVRGVFGAGGVSIGRLEREADPGGPSTDLLIQRGIELLILHLARPAAQIHLKIALSHVHLLQVRDEMLLK